MRVLVTGGCGFLASHITERLLDRGDRVLVLDTLVTGRRDNLPQEHDHLNVVSDADPLGGDICNMQKLRHHFNCFEPDIVIHAAASYKDPYDWMSDAAVNCVGTANVVKCAKEHNIKKLIYFQTSLCYGLHPKEHPITIKCPIDPRGSSYAITKTAGEFLIANSGVNFVSFRLANCFGPRNLSGPVPTFYQRLSQNKPCFVMDTRRDFIFVDDLVRLVLHAIDGEGKQNYYHVSTGRDFAIKELYANVRSAMGMLPDPFVQIKERTSDDVAALLIDPSETHKDFPGWKAETDFKEGIRKHIGWCKIHDLSETYTHIKLNTYCSCSSYADKSSSSQK